MRPSKQKQFDDYVRKWGMSDFRFFVHARYTWSTGHEHNVYIVRKGTDIARIHTGKLSLIRINVMDDRIGTSDLFEIRSLHRLLARFAHPNTRFFIYDNGDTELESLEEVKKYFLVRKISGV